MVQGTGRHLISDKKKASGRLIDTQVCFLKASSDPLILSQDSLRTEPGLFILQQVNNNTENDEHFAEDNYALAKRGDGFIPLK